jgi:hypothetical protein
LDQVFNCGGKELYLIYPSIVSPGKDIQDERPFKGETWGDIAYPPISPLQNHDGEKLPIRESVQERLACD